MRTVLLEFLYSAILWGSLITWVLWQLRKQSTSGIARKLLWLPLAWFGLHTALAWYGFLLPPSGRLVDADSNAPIGNARVKTSWVSYPLSLWTTVCSGEQAHLSDADGDFAFRFAPLPTLLFGTLYRGQMFRLPGRVLEGRGGLMPMPVFGTMPIHRIVADHRVDGDGPFWQCEVVIGPSATDELLPGEVHPFEAMYREGCIEQQRWTLTDRFLWDLSQYSAQWGGTYVARPPAPEEIAELTYTELGNKYCPGVLGVCAHLVEPNVRDQFCTYFKTFYDDQGLPQ